MKNTFIILFSFSCLNIFSQDITRYFPLSVGNVWVYSCSAYSNPPNPSCVCILRKYRYQITGTIIKNNKTYFLFSGSQSSMQCAGCYAPPYLGDTLRIDSLTGNIYKYSLVNGCSYSPFEIMYDSLRARMNDTVWINCGVSQGRYKCTDTSSQSILGASRKTKGFNEALFESNQGRKFAFGIGMVSAGMNSVSCQQNFSTLIGCVIDGVLYGDTSMLVGVHQISTETPEEFSLSQNYPNPFNPMTKLKFQIPKSGFTNLTIFDVLGREVQVLVNQDLQPGTYEIDFDGSNLPSGVYYYRFDASTPLSGTYTETKKMVLIK